MKEGKAFGYVKDVPWFDIGTPGRYLNACLETVRRGIFNEMWQAEVLSSLGNSSEVIVAAGPGTKVDSGAYLAGDCVLGSNCRIHPDARIQRSLLWDGVVVGRGAVVRSSIVAAEVQLAPGSQIENKIVLNAEKMRDEFRAREVTEGHVVAEIKR
jgi:NDP-sugar pyrophosphorylase family protein